MIKNLITLRKNGWAQPKVSVPAASPEKVDEVNEDNQK